MGRSRRLLRRDARLLRSVHVGFGQSSPQCVLHGDGHLGNLYIDTDGAPGLFDPLASRGPG
jgi:hypothetical protein